MTHKPKLVAVTSCSPGAGVTSLASGLAASLSETGDGKVLLVDMNLGKGAVHPFYRGGSAPALLDSLDSGPTEGGRVQENLYLASAGDQESRQSLMVPNRFGDLIPRMRASEFDYIIFDMPPIRQTSATLTLSSFMDEVLLVVESNKTERDVVKRAHSLLRQAGTNVFAVFNKSRTETPDWLHGKF